MEKCIVCGKEFQDLRKSNGIKKIYCSEKCLKRFSYLKNSYKRNNPEFKEKRRKYLHNWYKKPKNKKYCKEWYEVHKEQVFRNMKNNYNNNRNKWRERNYTFSNRNKILNILPKECHFCKKIGIKEIHHITYDVPKRYAGGKNQGIRNKIYLKKYCKLLLGFCSRKCHRDFEYIQGI